VNYLFGLLKSPKSFSTCWCSFLSFVPNVHITIPCHKSASDDLENPDKLRSLLKDLREARQAKSRDGLKTLDHSELSVSCFKSDFLFYLSRYNFYINICHIRQQLPNLCSMEINEIRPFFVQSMSILTQLVRNPAANPSQSNI
jgi:GINS complex subunit 2